MERIVVEIMSSVGRKRGLYVFDKTGISIGRSYANDLILQDDCVEAEHLRVTLLEDGVFSVEDRNSRNGTFLTVNAAVLQARERVSNAVLVQSGQIIVIGHSVLRVFNAEHAIDATHLMPTARVELFKLHPVRSLCYVLAGSLLVYFFHIRESLDELRVSTGKILFIESLIFLGLMLWPGIWALLGRLIIHRMRFVAHLKVTLVYAVVVLIVANILAHAGYFFMSEILEVVLQALFACVAFAWLFFWNLTYATNLPWRARMITVVMIPGVLIGLLIFGVFMSQEVFKPEPPYYARLKPSYMPVYQVLDADGAIKKTSAVFAEARKQEPPKDFGPFKL